METCEVKGNRSIGETETRRDERRQWGGKRDSLRTKEIGR